MDGSDDSSQVAAGTCGKLSASALRAVVLPQVEPAEALRGLSPFTPKVVLGAWRHRHKNAFQILSMGGVTDAQLSTVFDPYTGVERQEDFRNIFEHNLAVGFVSAVLADWLISAGKITPDERDAIVVHGMTHDTTKPYEIFRKRFSDIVTAGLAETQDKMRAGVDGASAFSYGLALMYQRDSAPKAVPSYARALAWRCIEESILPAEGDIHIEAGTLPDLPKIDLDLSALAVDQYFEFLYLTPDTVRAHESLPEALRRSNMDPVTMNALLDSRGFGASPETCLACVHVDAQGDLLVQGSWVQKIVFLADNMTATTIPKPSVPAATYLLTPRERQVVSELSARYPGMTGRGLAKDPERGIIDVEVATSPRSQLLGSYLQLQWYLSNLIAAELATIQAGKTVPAPDVHVKKAVNTALRYYQ